MRQAKGKLLYTLALLLVGVAGVILGILFQRNYGVGNTLRTAGLLPPLPTPVPNPPTPTPTPFGIPEQFQGKLSLFILAGQSNMSGYAELPLYQEVNPRVFLFGNDYHWKIAAEPIDSPIRQVDEVSKDGGAGFSPGLAFATSLLKQEPKLVIGLIPCSKGNTSIEQWQRDLSNDTLYGSCLKRARAASTMGEIAGLLFFQGEADALDPEQNPDRLLSAFEYAAKFSGFAADFRDDLALPNLPLVFAQIGSNTAPEAFLNWRVVQEQQATVKLSCGAMITTRDLPLRDGVHFTTESYQIIGERFSKAYLDLMSSQSCK
jgi:hypothetical protein